MLAQSPFNPHVCWVCDQPVDELKKASTIEMGVGQELPAHDACLQALSDEVDLERVREQSTLLTGDEVAELISAMVRKDKSDGNSR